MWEDDNAQFARLLSEINAVGLHDDDKTAICESMDITPVQLDQLFDRAERKWEALKRANLPNYTPDTDFDEPEPMLTVSYRCPVDDGGCGHEWQENYTSACDSECPKCGLANITALDWEETDGYIQVEFDLEFSGGDYDDTGDFAYVPVSLVAKWGVEEAFRQHTKHDPQHIIHYTQDEIYNKEGELKDDDEEA